MDVLEQMAENERKHLGSTMKEITLMRLVEAGIVQREENGDVVEPAMFEQFWREYEKDIGNYAYWCLTRPALARYENAQKTDRTANRGAHKRNFGIEDKFLFAPLALLLGILALLLILR